MINPFTRKLEAIRPLTDHHRRKLDDVTGWVQKLKPQTMIMQQGGRPLVTDVVLSGWAHRYKILPDGRRQITALFLPGDLCDPFVLLLGATDHAIGTLTPATIARVSVQELRDLTASAPELTEALWWQALLAVEIQREWMVSLGRRTALERLAHLFCEVSSRLALVDLSDGVQCDCPLTQADMADVLGLSTVHVNRSLQELRASRLIELRSRRLTILDRQRLEELAMFDPTYLHRCPDGDSPETKC